MDRRTFAKSVALAALLAPALTQAKQNSTAKPVVNVDDLIERASEAMRSSGSPLEAFAQWSTTAAIVMPFLHMTALVAKEGADPAAGPGDVRRVYSSVPSAYPVGGWKHLAGSDWAAHVLQGQRILVASGEAQLKHYFPDHALLASLGTRTLVNIPVVVCRRTIGALAFLCEQASIDSATINELHRLVPSVAPAFLLSTDSAG